MEILFLVFLGLTAFFLVASRSRDSGSDSTHVSAEPLAHHVTAVRGRAVQEARGVAARVSFLESLAEASVLAVGTMVAVAAVAVGTVVIGTAIAAHAAAGVIRSVLDEHSARRADSDPTQERNRRERDVEVVNAEIESYEDKRRRDGRLNEYDAHALTHLYRDREERVSLLSDANGLVMVERMTSGAETYETVHVTDDNTHVLQFHVGQSVLGKFCGRCGMPMVLQWQQRLETVQMRDFFWGCGGFYGGTCRNVEPFRQWDMDLFTRTDREEFAVGAEQLSSIARVPQAVRVVGKRMNEIVNVANRAYYCPVHHEPMVLRRKKGAERLRDMYFYGCPRWRSSGCRQIVKLKSAAQLSAALETATGHGIL